MNGYFRTSSHFGLMQQMYMFLIKLLLTFFKIIEAWSSVIEVMTMETVEYTCVRR